MATIATETRPTRALAPDADAVLVVEDLVKRFDTPDGPLTAVDGVSFSVRKGEFLSVISFPFILEV